MSETIILQCHFNDSTMPPPHFLFLDSQIKAVVSYSCIARKHQNRNLKTLRYIHTKLTKASLESVKRGTVISPRII